MKRKERAVDDRMVRRYAEQNRVPQSLQLMLSGVQIMKHACRDDRGKYALFFAPDVGFHWTLVAVLAFSVQELCDMIAVHLARLLAGDHPFTCVREVCRKTAYLMGMCFPACMTAQVELRYTNVAFHVAVFHDLQISYGWVASEPIQMTTFPLRQVDRFEWFSRRTQHFREGTVYANVISRCLADNDFASAMAFGFTCRWALMLLRTAIGGDVLCFQCNSCPRWEHWIGDIFFRVHFLKTSKSKIQYVLKDHAPHETYRVPFWRTQVKTLRDVHNFIDECEMEHEMNDHRFSHQSFQ